MKKEKLHQLNSATLKSLHQHPAPQTASGKPPTCHTLLTDQTQHGERRLNYQNWKGKPCSISQAFLLLCSRAGEYCCCPLQGSCSLSWDVPGRSLGLGAQVNPMSSFTQQLVAPLQRFSHRGSEVGRSLWRLTLPCHHCKQAWQQRTPIRTKHSLQRSGQEQGCAKPS